MKKHFSWFLYGLLILSVTIISWKPGSLNRLNLKFTNATSKELLDKYITAIYDSAHLQESGLALNVFEKAITGFINLKAANKAPQNSSILTVIDFTKSSCEKRMWIVDVLNKTLILNTWVAHGQGSGEDIATHFSDKIDSHESSLGFYITDNAYSGKNGLSLRLDGMDDGFNINARTRAIVIHGADYVSKSMIEQNGRLGRSYGCPAVSPEVSEQVINTLKDKTVIFINGNNDNYSSKYLDGEMAANFVLSDTSNTVIANL